MAAAIAATLAVSACDLPTNADEARQHLGRNQQERIVPLQLPLPEISVTLADQLGELSTIVDTTDLSFGLEPDTFAFGLDTLMAIDPVDPAAITQGYDLAIGDFSQEVDTELPAIPLDLPGLAPQTLSVTTVPAAFELPVPLDLGDAFTTASFSAGSAFEVTLTTDESATLVDVETRLEDDGGAVLATSSGGPITVDPSTTETLSMDLTGVDLPSSLQLVISMESATGDNTGDELTVSAAFVDAEVTAATGVDADRITPVQLDHTVTLDVTGSDFSQATMAAGTVSVAEFSIGTLDFQESFDGDLAGLQIGGTNPSELVVSGTVGPPDGAATVDISTTAEITIAFTGLEVASVTLNSVSMDIEQSVDIQTDGTLDGLEEVVIESGMLQVVLQNRLGITGDVELTLTGITDQSGDVLSQPITVAASPDGQPEETIIQIDLADATLDPSALAPTVSGTIGGTDVTVTPAAAAEAISVDPYLEIQPRSVVLSSLPDLAVELDERIPVATGDIDLGELSDFVENVSFNDVAFTVTVANGTGLDVQVADFAMSLLDATGDPVLDEDDQPIRTELSDEATGVTLAPAGETTELMADAADLVNGLLDRIAAGQDVQLAASGSMGPAGEGGSISLGDSIAVVFEIRLSPDITINPAGISLDQVVHEAIALDSVAAEFMANLSEDLVLAGIEFEAVNGLPLGLSLAMTLAPTPMDTTGFDPFASPNRLDLPEFSVPAAAVDDEGRVTSPTISSPEATVNADEFGVLAERTLSMGMRATILPPDGGRAVLQPTDSLVLRPLLKIEIRVGGNGGTQ